MIAYLFLKGDSTAQVEKLLEVDSEWTVPFLWRSEFRSVLAFYVRQKIIALDLALRIAREAELMTQDREYEVNSTPVLNLVAGSRCSAYDCEFVVLAQGLNVPLVTSDKRILSEFPSTAVSLEQFTS
ncbi:MAG: VapC toxin family PIN domain ribonuclease [Acidobacteria bacterium]|nr:MAG: VapC toxin family PIN domain ribonuclease [Acidobacteriota bacterium]